MGKRIAAVALLLSFWAGLASPVSAHTAKEPSRISFAGFQQGYVGDWSWDPQADAWDYFFGSVVSGVSGCVPGRKIEIYRRLNFAPDLFIAKGRVSSNGNFRIWKEDPGNGSYYVLMRAADVHPAERHRHICRGNRSRPIVVTDESPEN